jgi:glycosyltransferase involved in cell wall biosynthesis
MDAMGEATQPLVSVVTPFHNTDEYLAECIESVLAQTRVNFEYILVDNQSTDDSRAIAERYARIDPRIRLLETSRLLSQRENYNFALGQISPASIYCKIVQADDSVFPECLERMVAAASLSPSIGLVGAYSLWGTKVAAVGLPMEARVVPGRELCRRQLLEGTFFFGSPTSVLYRSDLVRARVPFYPDNCLHMDTEVCYEILEHYDFGFVHQVLTFTRTDNESISSRASGYFPDLLDRLIVGKRHGHRFLSEPECRRYVAQLERAYYRRLGMCLIRGRRRDFWAYHRAGLAAIGEQLAWGRVAGHAALEIFDHLLNPLRTAQLIWTRLRQIGRPPGFPQGFS